MRRSFLGRGLLTSLFLATACGGSSMSSPAPRVPPYSPTVNTRSTQPATVTNDWTSVTGTVTLETVDGVPRLTVSAPPVAAHFVASAVFVFRDAGAPSVRTYTQVDAGPGTIFEVTDVGGDIDSWQPGVGGMGAGATLTFDEVSATAVHGELSVDLMFGKFDATF